MPANLPPEYYEIEEKFQNASRIDEKISALNEMLSVIPKHKGTDKLRARLRRKLSNLKEESKKSKGGEVQENPYLVEKQGAGQVVLVGFPNSGKSSLVQKMTNAKVEVASYPFTTSLPQPGMMPYEDIKIQLVDTPPITEEGIPGPFISTISKGDLLLLFVDIAGEDCVEQMEKMLKFLQEKNIYGRNKDQKNMLFNDHRCLTAAAKIDIEGSEERLEILKELIPDHPELIPISSKTGKNLDRLKQRIFEKLNVIRIYTKAPGRKADTDNPFVLRKGASVIDFAGRVHKDLANNFKKAHLWGSARFDGQNVGKDYQLEDQDIVEIHTSS